MSTITHTQYSAPLEEFKVETEMTAVEILRVSPDRILAKGKRYGRMWLLRGLPPDKRSDPGLLRELREEFDRRFSCMEPGIPLTVGMEEIEGLGPCIVEEWREDYHGRFSLEEKGEGRSPVHRLILRRAVVLTVALISVAGALGAALHISRLTALSETVKADLEVLRIANRQGEERMHILADSLDKAMRGSQMPEELDVPVETVVEESEEMMAEALYMARIKEFKKELVRYDRYVIPAVTDDLPVFYDSICALYRRMMDMGGDVDPYRCFPQLPEDERIRITSRLYEGYMLCLFDYARVWIPKARGAYEKKRKNDSARKERNK
ncbi:MAG: hypothetical protein K2L00_01890 [Muribaculaceae bacterium]|nr:hypothetical protein [Muribaculaceae bacterium]